VGKVLGVFKLISLNRCVSEIIGDCGSSPLLGAYFTFTHSLLNSIKMTTSIYITYKELPASIKAVESFNKAVEVFEMTVKAIKADLKIAEDKFIEERKTARENAKWDYFMTEPTCNEYGLHYHIHRKSLNPQLGDDSFYKDIEYCSFKIVNNVFISTGGGNQFRHLKNGDIVSAEEIKQLEEKIVPERFKNEPLFTTDEGWYSGT
jgi:hypothetical protein